LDTITFKHQDRDMTFNVASALFATDGPSGPSGPDAGRSFDPLRHESSVTPRAGRWEQRIAGGGL
jgi:hypothetical protein